MFLLEYNEATDTFSDPDTAKPYTGPAYSLFDDGKTETQGFIKDGKLDGEWVEYWPNGKPSSRGTYTASIENGSWQYWWENGQIEAQGALTADVPTGEWQEWSEDGLLLSKGSYVSGQQEGEWMITDPKSGKHQTVVYKNGKPKPLKKK